MTTAEHTAEKAPTAPAVPTMATMATVDDLLAELPDELTEVVKTPEWRAFPEVTIRALALDTAMLIRRHTRNDDGETNELELIRLVLESGLVQPRITGEALRKLFAKPGQQTVLKRIFDRIQDLSLNGTLASEVAAAERTF